MNRLPAQFFTHHPWQDSGEPIWPASVFTLRRNIEPYLFPALLPDAQKEELSKRIFKALAPLLDTPLLITGKELTPPIKEFLSEHFLLQKELEDFDANAALVIDNSAAFLALIHVENHLTLRLMNLSITRQNEIEEALSKDLSFAFSPRFGYLTSKANLAGTALSMEAYLHLPALIQADLLDDLTSELMGELSVHGLSNESNYLADLILLENRYKLGLSEETIIDTVSRAAKELVKREKELRQTLKNEANPTLKDKVSRAYGLLAHSYQIQTKEALSALSLVHLGKELNWIEGADNLSFHDLFFHCRRAHLSQELPSSSEQPLIKEELLQKRALLLQDSLKDSRLTI